MLPSPILDTPQISAKLLLEVRKVLLCVELEGGNPQEFFFSSELTLHRS